MNSNPRVNSAILAAGDFLMIGLFVLLGETNHAVADPQPMLRWLITTLEFALPWFIVAWLTGVYQTGHTTRTLLGKTLAAWLIAAPLGALLRSFVNGSGVIASTFLVVTLVVGCALLLVWRAVYLWLARKS
jgi:hypothetical protein